MAYALGGEAAWYQPPDPLPECSRCDGDGKNHPTGEYEIRDAECPHCNGTGVEPLPDPLDDPRIP